MEWVAGGNSAALKRTPARAGSCAFLPPPALDSLDVSKMIYLSRSEGTATHSIVKRKKRPSVLVVIGAFHTTGGRVVCVCVLVTRAKILIGRRLNQLEFFFFFVFGVAFLQTGALCVL